MKVGPADVDSLGVNTLSYLHRPTVELLRIGSASPTFGRRIVDGLVNRFGATDQQAFHRVAHVDLESLTVQVDSADRFRVGERLEIRIASTTSIAMVESIEHNDLSGEQRYCLQVEPSILGQLIAAMGHAPIALAERRHANRPLVDAHHAA